MAEDKVAIAIMTARLVDVQFRNTLATAAAAVYKYTSKLNRSLETRKKWSS